MNSSVMNSSVNSWYYRSQTLAADGWDVVVGDHLPGWSWTGLRVGTLDGATLSLRPGKVERIVIPLRGECRVATADASYDLAGRDSVFAGPTDVLYLGIDTAATLTGSGQVAVAEARATEAFAPVHLAASEVPVELRGAGNSSRQVNNFGVPDVLPAQKIIACEVLTPAGNWSSYPPHKHDTDRPGQETVLEEIYYFESRVEPSSTPTPQQADPFGLQRVFASDEREIDVNVEVRSGDVVLVPCGWHGPSVAAPGYDLYYLNVMAGPGAERAWRICDHPSHAWVRGSWPAQNVDPRLPFSR